jgi:hypothetical protein
MMKRSGILLLLFLVVVRTLNAQRFKAGINVGLLASDINGADTRDKDNDFSKLGFTAGFLVNTQISKKNKFQLELNFIQKGSQQRPDSMGNGYYKIALSYVEVPLIIRRQIYFTKRQVPVNRIDLEAGVSVGRMVSHYVVNSSNTVFTGYDNLFNSTDVSLLIGADYNISKHIVFCLRYSNSVIPAIKRNTPNVHFITYTFNRGNNMVLQFTFKFVFGGKVPDTTPQVKDTQDQQ